MDIFWDHSKKIRIADELKAVSGLTYEIGEFINRGGNAAVYECINSNGDLFAIKFLLNLSDKMIIRFEREINTLKSLKHPHIIGYVDSGVVESIDAKDKTLTIPFLIMERADKNLFDFMKNTTEIGYEIYAPQFRGLSEALGILHNIAIHRDLKPENILVKGERWLISDLGLCSFLDDEANIDLTREHEKIGPKYWLSPEAINKWLFSSDEIDKSSDVFQLCAVFWFVITRRHPLGLICTDDFIGYNEEICDVIIKSMSYCRSKRPSDGFQLYQEICDATINQ